MKCKISLILQFSFIILFSLVVFPTFAQQTHSKKKNAIQLQRERVDYGDTITSFSFTAIKFISAKSSLRLSFSSAPFLQKKTVDYYSDNNDPSPEDRIESRKGYHVLIGYFFSIPVSEDFVFTLGSAPFYIAYEEQNWGMMYWDGIYDAGQVESTTTISSTAFGLSFSYGFEYFFYKNWSFNFDLGVSFSNLLSHERRLSKSSGTRDGEYYYHEYIQEDNNQFFRFSANQSRFGVAVYF